jgi:hypothetical protein
MNRSALRHATLAAVVCLLLVQATALPATGARSSADDRLAVHPPVVDGPGQTQQTQPTTDNTLTRIELHENGSARWTVQVRTALDTETAVEQYRIFQASLRNNSSRYLDPFRDRIRATVRTASDETGREMRATDFAISTRIQEVPRRWGVVTYRFTWTNFSAPRDDALVVGDAFGSGFYLSQNDSLELVAPPEYELTDVEPTPDDRDDGVVAWTGREDFAPSRPAVRAEPAATGGTGTTQATGATTSPGTPASGPNPSANWLLGLAVVVFAVGVTLVWFRRRADEDGGPSAATDDSDDVDGPPPEGTAAGAAAGATAEPPLDGDLLTDEDRVRRILEAADGRVKQAEVAERLDWSASKTSRVVTGMADDGVVRKLRIGRENVLELADPDADDAGE